MVLVESAYIRCSSEVTLYLGRVRVFVSSAARLPDGQRRKALWGANIAKSPPTVRYADAMQSDQGLYKWLSNIVGVDVKDSKYATDDCIGPIWVLPRFWRSRHSRSDRRVDKAHWIHS